MVKSERFFVKKVLKSNCKGVDKEIFFTFLLLLLIFFATFVTLIINL